jgi:cbb3-type cytochrome oxidase maturation protein
MSFLAVTLPLSLLLAGLLVAFVVQAARRGGFDDWEGPAWRHHFDDDRAPERDATRPD